MEKAVLQTGFQALLGEPMRRLAGNAVACQAPRTPSSHSGLWRPHSAGRFCVFSHLLLAPGRVSRCGPALQHRGTERPLPHAAGRIPSVFVVGTYLGQHPPSLSSSHTETAGLPSLTPTPGRHPHLSAGQAPASRVHGPGPRPSPGARAAAGTGHAGSAFWSLSRGRPGPLLLPLLSPPLSWPGTRS